MTLQRTSPVWRSGRRVAESTLDVKRWRAQLLLLALGVALAVALAPFASGLLGSLVLAVALTPLHRWLTPRLGVRGAAFVALVLGVVLLLLPASWLVAMVASEAPEIVRGIYGSGWFDRLAALHVGGVDVGGMLGQAGGAVVGWLSGRAIGIAGGVVHGTLNAVIAFFGLYYLLVGGERHWHAVREYLPLSHASADELRARFRLVTEATLLGTGLTALLQGTVVGLGFWAVGLPRAPFWGAITALASILPVLGSAFVWLPASLGLATQGRYAAALVLAAIGAIVASNIDNVARPLVNRRVSNLHPMTTLVGAFAGVGIFGLAGLLLGPLAISYFFELLRLYERDYGDGARAIDAGGATRGTAPLPSPDRPGDPLASR